MTQQLTEILSSRFKILERPFAHPGKCAVCGAVNRPVVDFGMDLDEYGVVYFCITCLTQVAHDNLDMVYGSELRESQSTVEDLTNKLTASAGKIDDYISSVRSLHDNFIRNLLSDSDLSSSESVSGPEKLHESDSRQEHGEVRDSESDATPRTESIGDEGPFSLSGSSGNGERPFNFT